jgi:hypothetical protein
MRKARIGMLPTQRNGRAGSYWNRSAIAALSALAIGVYGECARAQEVLRWKFKAGDVLKYTTEQKMLMSIKGSTVRARKQTRTQTIQFTWTIKQMSDDGSAEILQKIDRLTMRVEAPPFMPFEFDSNKPDANVDEPFEAEVKQMKATIGAEFSFKMKPSGEIADIRIPEATLKKLKDALPAEEVGQGEFSEQALKDVLIQSSPPPFPEVAVEPGKTWSSKPAKLTLPQGSMVTDKVFTFQGPDPNDPKLMLIGMEARVTFEPGENLSAKIKAQEGKGSLAFDAEAGRIVNSRSVQRTEMLMSSMGQEIDQTTEMTSTMTLTR